MSTGIVDREHEVARLRRAAGQPPQLVIMRGRRRVGKSFLLNHALSGYRGISFQADEQPASAQLDLFAREAARLLPGAPPLRFGDWDEALTFVGDQAASGPLVVVLDEFQWLWASEPHLDSILQRHWDAWQRAGTPVTMVLAGSALSLMERLLAHANPLYGRAQYRPLVQPLDYRYAAQFADPQLPADEKLMRYAVLGGTPQYQVWAGDAPLREVLAGSILAVDEALYEEPLHLMRSEPQLREPGSYFAVVAAIARGASRTGEIANVTGLDIPNLTKLLGRLVSLGYLELRGPVAPRPEAKRSIYRLRDPYLRFWFRFVFPNRSLLARGRVEDVLAEIERDLPTFLGLAFEDCCREWVGRYAPSGLLPACEELGAWWSRDGQVEVDVAGVRNHRFVLLGSCKWDRRVRTGTLGRLLDHRESLGPLAADAQLVIFGRGFDGALAERAPGHGVMLVSADDLFTSDPSSGGATP
jgi:hypothetical protein